MTRVQGRTNGSGYLAIAYAGEVRLYRTDDSGTLNFPLLASASANVGTAPRRLRLESQGPNHRIYFNGALALSYTENSVHDGTTGHCRFGVRRADGQDSLIRRGCPHGGHEAASTNERTTHGGVAGRNQPDQLESDDGRECHLPVCHDGGCGLRIDAEHVQRTGGTAHSTLVSGLVDSGSYSYYVRCQDGTGNANPDDFVITFSVARAVGGHGKQYFSGIEDPLSENGMWDTPGAWTSLKKNRGVYSTNRLSAARLVTPVVGADQYARDHLRSGSGSSSWAEVMTRVQGMDNGSGYLAIAYAGEVRLYRSDESSKT